MCGLSTTIIDFKKNDFKLFKYIQLVNTNINYKNYSEVLDLLLQFKNNYIFIELVRNNKIIKKFFLDTVIKIKLIKKNNLSNKFIDLIEDIIWLIEKDILEKSESIKKIINNKKFFLCDNLIIFLRYYLYELESLDYLETRGRDSASLSITFTSNTKFKLNENKNKNNNSLSVSLQNTNNKKYSTNITAKYANRIGYSGENSKNLNNNLLNSKILNKIVFDEIFNCIIISHTRWASVGPVDLHNCHPLINNIDKKTSFYSMNGDITNYLSLNKKLKSNKDFYLDDKKCTNDLTPLPSIFIKNKINLLQGSYVIFYHELKKSNEIKVIKKGSQGLYFSFDNDQNLCFSSDVYGIVNRTNKFQIIKDDISLEVNDNFKKKYFRKKIKTHITSLSTRDLSKKNYKSFFLKEINDTSLFLKRTIFKNVNLNKNELNENKIFNKKILKKINKGLIKNIIFTGMGSCYTAAVGITKYLSSKLPSQYKTNIKIEATLASEGSGFYLSSNMNDTIIVVLAQSGTTIDTNVFAKMARERGAYTIALVNKKQGDVTYIVQKNLYLGNGRDVELSVPSTKTYTCHLLLGYIFSEYLINAFTSKKTDLIPRLNKIVKNDIINNYLERIRSEVKRIKVNPIKYKNWIVLFDDSINAFSALELRIKLSECCYKAIPYLNIKQFNKKKIKDSLIFYIGTKKPNIELNKDSYLIAITKKNILEKKNIRQIKILSSNFINISLESAVALQILAYEIAIKIDNYSGKKFKKNDLIKNFVINPHENNSFNKIPNKERNKIIIERLKRPIDTIKHQAKTITVGALRKGNLERVLKNKFKENKNFIKKDNFNHLFSKLNNNISIFSDEINEVNKYFIGNVIELCNSLYSKNKFFNFSEIKYLKNNDHSKTSNLIFTDKKEYNKTKNNFYFYNKSYNELIKIFLKNDYFSNKLEDKFLLAKNFLKDNKKDYSLNIEKYLNDFNNIKFLGSGINYLVAKKYAQVYSHKYNRTIAYDVIENHKHIDISSESLLIILTSNIYRKGFQDDVYSEIEKFIAHDNQTLIFSNIGNNIYDQLNAQNKNKKFSQIIKLPKVNEIYSPSLFDYYFKNFVI